MELQKEQCIDLPFPMKKGKLGTKYNTQIGIIYKFDEDIILTSPSERKQTIQTKYISNKGNNIFILLLIIY